MKQNYTALGHKLRFFRRRKAQFVTVGIYIMNKSNKSGRLVGLVKFQDHGMQTSVCNFLEIAD